MITTEQLDILRCPIDPKRQTRLVVEEDVRLFCSRCRVQFRIRDGFPSLVIEDAILPAGCAALSQLPCQQS
jgi:uncharacterized protein